MKIQSLTKKINFAKFEKGKFGLFKIDKFFENMKFQSLMNFFKIPNMKFQSLQKMSILLNPGIDISME